MRHLVRAVIAVLAIASPVPADDAAPLPPSHAAVSYGPSPMNVLDLWQANGDGPRPLVVYVHGGGWMAGNRFQPATNIRPFLERGISYAALSYRLTTEAPLPAPVRDVARAIQFIRSKAEEWRIDKKRIALTGGSAGGCTAMWILLHDDLADPRASDPVLRESTRVSAAAVRAAQASIEPRVLEGWLGPKVLENRMLFMAVGAPSMVDVLAHYEKYRPLYVEFSPYNHLSADDPPLFMSYPKLTRLPVVSAWGIHHATHGIKMKEKADRLGVECHLVIRGAPRSARYASAEEFLTDKLLAPVPQPSSPPPS